MKKYDGFADLLNSRSDAHPDAPALLYEQQGRIHTLSYLQLRDAVQASSRRIRSTGCQCIGILCDGTIKCVITIFASVLAGIQTVLLEESASEELLARQLHDAQADTLWGDTELAQELGFRALEELIGNPADGSSFGVSSACSGSQPHAPASGDFPETAGDLLFFTSGTTSRSKAVVLSDRSLTASAYNGSCILPLAEKDRLLCMLPLNHVFGFVCSLLWGLACGASVSLGRGARHYADDPVFFSPTVLSAVPALLAFLLRHNALNAQLRTVLVGAGNCPPSILELARKNGLHVCFGYGMTETSSGIALSIEGDPYALTICPLNEVQIAPDGEILVRSEDCMMKGYYRQPEMTAAVLENGTLHTGDLGRIDENGRLHITGRKKEIIVLSDGTKIFLPEYEAAISQAIGEQDFAVIEQNQQPVLVIHADPASRPVLLQKLKAAMARYPRGQQLHDILFRDAPLPRTSTGKVRRWELQTGGRFQVPFSQMETGHSPTARK